MRSRGTNLDVDMEERLVARRALDLCSVLSCTLLLEPLRIPGRCRGHGEPTCSSCSRFCEPSISPFVRGLGRQLHARGLLPGAREALYIVCASLGGDCRPLLRGGQQEDTHTIPDSMFALLVSSYSAPSVWPTWWGI